MKVLEAVGCRSSVASANFRMEGSAYGLTSYILLSNAIYRQFWTNLVSLIVWRL